VLLVLLLTARFLKMIITLMEESKEAEEEDVPREVEAVQEEEEVKRSEKVMKAKAVEGMVMTNERLSLSPFLKVS
jgi:hypothetical protein